MTDHPPTSEGESASTESKPNWRRELEARGERATELEAKVAELERREVFREAGINPSEKMASYFVKGYEGDLTVEAIQAEAAAAGITGRDSTSTEEPFQGDLEGEQRIARAADDAGPVTDLDLNQRIRMTTNEEELRQVIEAAGGTFSAAE